MASIGRGANTYKLRRTSLLNILYKQNPIKDTKFIKYIIEGPVYILTLLTSSVIRLIKSPVLWVL